MYIFINQFLNWHLIVHGGQSTPLNWSRQMPLTITLFWWLTLVVALILALLISCFEIATDKTITNKQKYLRQRFGYNQTRGEDTCVTNAATQTILWASSRCGTPAPGKLFVTAFPLFMQNCKSIYNRIICMHWPTGRDIPSFCTVSTNALWRLDSISKLYKAQHSRG